MKVYTPTVKNIALFKEIAQNVVNPLEIIREAISNSHDAESKQISIIVYRSQEGDFVIELQDDGKGMDICGLQKFFNLGDSNKNQIGIGEKGLGTKTYFKSDMITVSTQTKDGECYKATMKKPWEMLNTGIIPEYMVENLSAQTGKCGTSIIITGYIIDNPEKYFNFETIKDYILWFTAGGSFKTYFANYTELHKYIQNMQVAPRIFLEDRILNIKEEIAGAHQFSPPQEKPIEDPKEEIYKKSANYCRHFGPYHRATNINGEYVSFQLYGTVSGINCRRKICKLRFGEKLKSRFGIYLAKDFIPFLKRHDTMPNANFQHFHILVNSQVFDFTADRNNISNEDDPKVKWVIDETKKILYEDIYPLAEDGYFKLRKQEEAEFVLKNKKLSLKLRVEKFDEIDNLSILKLPIVKRPDCEAQVVILFTSIMSNEKTKGLIKYIDKIGHYSHHASTDMVCVDKDNCKVLVEVEYKLSNLFKHDHPYDTFDYVICWNVDIDSNEKKKLLDGSSLIVLQEQGEWVLKYGAQKVIPVIELKDIVSKIEAEDKALLEA